VLDHFAVTVTDMSKSLPFYEACLEPLGIRVTERQPQYDAVIFTRDGVDFPFIWMGSSRASWWREDDEAGKAPIHFAFPAQSRAAVDAFHALGLANGGNDQGAPGLRPGGWYAAYLLDPDGNNVEAGIRE
jgi:catechol 2,3-dioxygenase-like lactoylglutathione lyase family enzyme